MPFSYPLTLPTNVKPVNCNWTLREKQAYSESPFTGSYQVYTHEGAYWEVDVEYPTMTRVQAAAWKSFLAEMRGLEGTFYFSDPDGAIRGSGLGTPVIAAGGFASNKLSVDTSGWDASETGVLLKGDWIQFSNYEYKMVVADVDSDGAGLATVHFAPAMREVVGAGTALTLTGGKGKFRFVNTDTIFNTNDMKHVGIRFLIREDTA